MATVQVQAQAQAHSQPKIWVTLVTKPATKAGKQMAHWGSRYLQLPQVTCLVSFSLSPLVALPLPLYTLL